MYYNGYKAQFHDKKRLLNYLLTYLLTDLLTYECTYLCLTSLIYYYFYVLLSLLQKENEQAVKFPWTIVNRFYYKYLYSQHTCSNEIRWIDYI